MIEKPITLEQYRTMLRNHDWTYYFSDDPRVYRAGETASTELRCLAVGNGDDWKRAYNTMHKLIFNNSTFGGEYTFPFPDVRPITDEKGGGSEGSEEKANPSL